MHRFRTLATTALIALGMTGCILPPGPGGYGMRGGPRGDYHNGGDGDYRGGGEYGGGAGFARGDRLPGQYMDGNHAVRDPAGRGLQPAPAGYGWFDVNGQFVLAAIATGIVASVLFLGPHH